MARRDYRNTAHAILLAAGTTLLEGGPEAREPKEDRPDQVTVGVPHTLGSGITEPVAVIMARERAAPPRSRAGEVPRLTSPRSLLLPGPGDASPDWDESSTGLAMGSSVGPALPQTMGVSFKAAGLSESGFVPPDTNGDVGPTQVVVHVNGRVKSFDRDGTPGALNVQWDTFWASVAGGAALGYPHVQYDRLSGRWFLLTATFEPAGNDILLAVSSGPTITDATSFTFFSFPTEGGQWCDDPSLGVDRFALYIGCDMFNSGTFAYLQSLGHVVRKSDLLAGSVTVTTFTNLNGAPSGPGMFSPRGVDNDDPQATEGYFIGVDFFVFSRLDLRRVTNPGGVPAISANLSLIVPTTVLPIDQPHSGSTRPLDTKDDRLFAASIRKNKITGSATLWSAHQIAVDTSGAGSAAGTRNGSRWYEIGSLTTIPAVLQSGTLFDFAAANPRGYIYPSVAQSGQGHMAIGATVAAANLFAGVAAAGRLRTDALGTTRGATIVQDGLGSYTSVGSGPQRWGDYSFTDVDPSDDMTFWTFQEYADLPINNWAVRVVELRAPAPATPATATPASVCTERPSVTIDVSGTSSGGTEFFDPGPDTGGPGFANRLTATVTNGIVVNSATFVGPTQVTVNVSTVGATAGPAMMRVTNPDGQFSEAAILTVNATPATPTASNNGPVCAGSTLKLIATTIPGATYSWTGPGGFTSTQQNPTIAGVTSAAAGTYRVTATVSGCTSRVGGTIVSVIPEGADCDDANACTAGETCEAGDCTGGVPVPTPEINNSLALSDAGGTTTLAWSDPPGAFNVYRGSLNSGAPWAYNQACFASHLAAPGTSDTAALGVGRMFFYLVTRLGACGESIPGRNSAGHPIPNPGPCP